MFKITSPRSFLLVCLLPLCVVGSLCFAQSKDSLYGREYPFMDYDSAERQEAVSKLHQQIDSKKVSLEHDSTHGYLKDILKELDIDIASQVLVFSKTSLQNQFISPANARAIYFNDEVYVAWVQDSELLEFASMDPVLGPVLFTLSQEEVKKPKFQNETDKCLRCHDSYSLTGGGTPRFLLGSGYHGKQGQMMYHEGRIMTDNSTPIRKRWGGWFVTGTHGDQLHLGNLVVKTAEDIQPENLKKNGNIFDLSPYTDIDPYLTPYSDIVALLVLEHQVEVQNLISRVNYLTQKAMTEEQPLSKRTQELLDEIYEELVRSIFFADAAEVSSTITGTSGYAENFSKLGPKDSGGRSLRELDLENKVFKYPLSYLVYSDAFLNMRELPLNYVKRRVGEILDPSSADENFGNLTSQDKKAIREILKDTLPKFLM